MVGISVALLSVAAILGLTIGLKYLTTREFLAYHALVAGKGWLDLDSGMRAIILGMLKIIGGGFVTLSITIAWLAYAVWKGVAWAPWATLTVASIGIGPALYVAIRLRSIRPGANTPVGPLVVGLALIIVGAGFALRA